MRGMALHTTVNLHNIMRTSFGISSCLKGAALLTSLVLLSSACGETAKSPSPIVDGGAGAGAAGSTSKPDAGTSAECTTGTWDNDGDSETACVPWTPCEAGEFVSVPGTKSHDQVCSGCASGSFSTTENSGSCSTYSACAVGTFISKAGSPTSDQSCESCPADTFTSAPNLSACLPAGACPAGTVETAPESATSDKVCTPCKAGEYCAGDTAAVVACAEGSWDHDSDPATACLVKTSCVAGESAVTGSATQDRVCTECVNSYSTTKNAETCTPWTNCAFGPKIIGSSTTDQSCLAAVQVAAGENTSCAINENGDAYCWGASRGVSTLPVGSVAKLASLGEVKSISLGQSHGCAVLADKTVKCWGENSDGQLGNNSKEDSYTPVAVSGLSNVLSVSAGQKHSCALITDGTVKCWGLNINGELGDGSFDESLTPTLVTGISNAQSISAGQFKSCAQLSTGAVQCWGFHDAGVPDGNGSFDYYLNTPVSIDGISTAKSVKSANTHSCALLGDNTVKCWGSNGHYELGDTTTTKSWSAVVSSGISNVKEIGTGQYSSCALLNTGTVSCWGENLYGPDGDVLHAVDRQTPETIPNLSGATSFDMGKNHSCAILSTGQVACWGSNNYNELGDGSTIDTSEPVIVKGE